MGHQKAAPVAQALAAYILLRSGAMTSASWMRFGFSPPLGCLWQAPYIDDIGAVWIGKPLASDHSLPARNLDPAACQRTELAHA